MRKFRDPKTGAIRFELSPDDVEKKKLYDKIKDLENRINQIEIFIKDDSYAKQDLAFFSPDFNKSKKLDAGMDNK
jgi:hypothetical protein